MQLGSSSVASVLQPRHLLLGMVAGLALAGSSGCGPSGPEVVPVSGTVTRGGKPVVNLYLNFLPGDGRPSWGTTDDQGHYTLHYSRNQEGARVGSHKVWVNYKPQPKTPQEEMEMIRKGKKMGPPPDIEAILQKYGDEATSPLKVEVKSDGSPVDLVLD